MNKMNKKVMPLCIAVSSVLFPLSAMAGDLSEFVTGGKAAVNLRYRYENVDQDNLSDEANASTLLSRFTWTSGVASGFSGLIEVDNVSAIGNDNYNSTENGNSSYPVVADPEGTEVNQAFISYDIESFGKFTAGRERINHSNQRFLGGVGWRQNEQTYDSVRYQSALFNNFTIDYSYIWNVNRIFGPKDGAQLANWEGEIHTLYTSFALAEGHNLGIYAYSLDLDDAAALSSRTYGIEYNGSIPITESTKLGVNLAYAQQEDNGDNPKDYSTPYYLAKLSLPAGPVNLTGGYEVLTSDNGVGFSTPLATLHAFQGFADKFLATPADGVEDIYLSVAGAISGVKLSATYHDFSADEGSADYGNEVDLTAAYTFTPKLGLLVKYASYNGDNNAPGALKVDVDKFWIMLSYSL